MTTPKDWRQVETTEDWMRHMEKRVMHEERRPRITHASDLLGPGFAPTAIKVGDWNSETTQFNGYFVTEAGTPNAPTDEVMYLGWVVMSSEGHGVQFAIGHGPVTDPVTLYARVIHVHPDAMPEWGDWAQIGGGGSSRWTNVSGLTIFRAELGYVDSTVSGGQIKRTTAASLPNPKVALGDVAPSATGPFAESGQVVQVGMDTNAVSVGDTIVTSSTTGGRGRADNAVTDPRFRLGIAQSSKSGGVSGSVQVLIA